MLRRGALRYAAGGRGLRRFATRTAPVAACSYNGTSRSKLGSNASPFSFHSDPRSKVPSLALCEEQGLCLWRQRCHTYSTACTAFGSRSTAAIKIASAKKEGDALLVTWEEEEDRGRGRDGGRFHYVWLRDSCLCAECYHQTTHQRLLDTTRIPADLVALDANVMDEGSKLAISWSDGHSSEFPVSWLMKNAYEHVDTPHEGGTTLKSSPGGSKTSTANNNIRGAGVCDFSSELWDSSISADPPTVKYEGVMNDEEEVLKWLSKIERHGFCFVEGTPVDKGATKIMMEKAGVIRHTIYGGFWDPFTDLSQSSDTAYTNLAIDLHTDGNYFSESPGIQVFHCLKFKGTGGLSTLVDGFKLAEKIRREHPNAFRILSSVALPYHYSDPGRFSYKNSFVPFTLGGSPSPLEEEGEGEGEGEGGEEGGRRGRGRRVVKVNFNNSDRLPVDKETIAAVERLGLPGSPVKLLYDAIRVFIETSRDKSLVYMFQLEPGRVLVFNNHRVLHARTAFTGTRELCGCYINREDYFSRLNVLAERFKFTP